MNCDNCKKEIKTVKVYFALGKWFCSAKCSYEYDKKLSDWHKNGFW